MDALAIRDTSAHNSSVADMRDIIGKTIFVENGLDKSVKLQFQVARDSDFTNVIDVSDEQTVAASTNTIILVEDYYPFIRIEVTATDTPTSGDITIYIHKNTRS